MTKNSPEPAFFETPSDFRKWLTKNSRKETELLVGFYKVGSKKPSITWPESVDEALCFGWIDGIRRSRDEESYTIRFTPRRANSTWSAVNIKKVAELTAKGLMKPEGIAAFEKRTAANSAIYSHEKVPAAFAEEYLQEFKSNQKAWDYFMSQAPSYRKVAIHIIMTAKQKTTQLNRLKQLINDSEKGQRLSQLSYKR